MDEPLPNAADLDAVSPHDVDAIRLLMENGRVDQQPSDAFLAAVAAGSPCARLRGEAVLMRGLLAQKRNDNDSAVRHYVAGLRSMWGSGSSIERRAVLDYAILCINQQRPLETMLLARRGCEIGPDDDFLGACGRLNLAGATMALGDVESATEMLRDVETVVPRLEGGWRGYIEAVLHNYGIHAACERGDAEAARASLHFMETAEWTGVTNLTMRCMRAHVAFVSGDIEETLLHLHGIRSLELPWDGTLAHCDVLEVGALLRLGQREQALAAAARIVERFEDPVSDHIPAGKRFDAARLLAVKIGSGPDSHDIAQRALALAAAAAMERVWEADRFRRELPGFEFLSSADRRAIDTYGAYFQATYAEVLDQMTRLLASGDRLPRIRHADGSSKLVGVCAWCRRVRGPEGLWLDVVALEPPCGSFRVTHGACEPCMEEALTEMNVPA